MFVSECLCSLVYTLPLLRLKAPKLRGRSGRRFRATSWRTARTAVGSLTSPKCGSGRYELQRPAAVEFVQQAPAAAGQALQVG